nr:protein O-linked-mannose beta-1,2-N-acetylglucosaminyltransferase 1-like [Cherax quadricarinatus]
MIRATQALKPSTDLRETYITIPPEISKSLTFRESSLHNQKDLNTSFLGFPNVYIISQPIDTLTHNLLTSGHSKSSEVYTYGRDVLDARSSLPETASYLVAHEAWDPIKDSPTHTASANGSPPPGDFVNLTSSVSTASEGSVPTFSPYYLERQGSISSEVSVLQEDASITRTVSSSKVRALFVSNELHKKKIELRVPHDGSLPEAIGTKESKISLYEGVTHVVSEDPWTKGLHSQENILMDSRYTPTEASYLKPTNGTVPGDVQREITMPLVSEGSSESKAYLVKGFLPNVASATEFLPSSINANTEDFVRAATLKDHILIDITVNLTGVSLYVDEHQVYSCLNKTMIWGNDHARLHAGLHLITLHQVTGQVMAAYSYMTWQPTSDTQFLEAVREMQDGRLLVIVGAPEFTVFLEEATITILKKMGALYIDRLAYKDAWCLLVHKGGRVVLEALTTSLPLHNLTKFDVSPLTLQVSVPRETERRCGWYSAAGMQERATFCETYDGYGDFCTCHDRPWSPLPQTPVEYRMQEVIPVAIVTARRLPHVLRQVRQMWASPGGTNTPITIFADGYNPEAQALAALLQVPVIHHHNPSPKGSSTRVNSHIKFVLQQVFQRYSQADKVIILEDDLELAPDFIPYFHQTAPLLTSDLKLFCVNAYNYNAFNHTAFDPTRLYRVHGAPAYGWMVRKTVAREMVNNWVTGKGMDWDLWVRQVVMGERDILVPEVPRSKHRGGGGVHVTGIEQQQYYDQRPLNTLPNVTLDVHGAELHNYIKFHYSNIRTGHVVRFSKHPCEDLTIPRHQMNESYVVYIDQKDELRYSSQAYYVVARCLGLDDHRFHENLHMMYTVSFYGNQLYIVGCPNSPFCITREAGNIYSVSLKDVDFADNHPFRKIPTNEHVALRMPPLSLSDELNLTNLIHYTI